MQLSASKDEMPFEEVQTRAGGQKTVKKSRKDSLDDLSESDDDFSVIKSRKPAKPTKAVVPETKPEEKPAAVEKKEETKLK